MVQHHGHAFFVFTGTRARRHAATRSNEARGKSENLKTVTARPLPPGWPAKLRLPKNGTNCPYSFLNRSKMIEVAVPGPWNNYCALVKSTILNPGAKRKIRLIDSQSLWEWLESLPTEGGTK
jgi:hypothetical protein